MSFALPQRRPPPKFVPHPFAYHQEVELEIATLTNMGQGLGRIDGWVVMVPFALPGERVRARVYRNDRNFSEADLVAVLTPSAERTEPRCALFGECGGCQYQHLAYPAQLAWKRNQLAELLEHMAGVQCAVAAPVPSPRAYGYRSKITPHFERPKGGSVGPIGFLRQGRGRQLIDVPRCEIATDAINATLTKVRADVQSRAGEFRKGATLLIREAGGAVLTNPKDCARESVCGLNLEFLAGDFFQNNPFILDAFVRFAVDAAAGSGAAFLVDAYCGCGLFSLAAAAHFQRVFGVEVSDSAVAQARANAGRNSIANAEFLTARAEAIFAAVPHAGADCAVLLDPPRAGCDEAFLAQLTAFRPRRIVYVSCNPATQMRDLRVLLAQGWRIATVQPFDLFPQTRHLECVITLDAPESP